MIEHQYRGRAQRIDMAEELAAAARGECLLCRICARHPEGDKCPRAAEWAKHWDERQRREGGQ